jgi:hypothetical protein
MVKNYIQEKLSNACFERAKLRINVVLSNKYANPIVFLPLRPMFIDVAQNLALINSASCPL